MKRILMVVFFLMMLTFVLQAVEEFKQVEQWNHGDRELYSPFGTTLVDNDGHVIAYFGKPGARLITPDDVISFLPLGQGPNEIYLLCAMHLYKGDLACIELSQKIKIFTKKDNNYKWKEAKWLKRHYYPQVIRKMIFFKNRHKNRDRREKYPGRTWCLCRSCI